jgi:hypothetical protein
MIQNPEPEINVLYNDSRLADLFDALDELHTAASEDQLGKVTTLNNRELVAWLREFVYTAQETIQEIDHQERQVGFVLRLVEKPPRRDKRQA